MDLKLFLGDSFSGERSVTKETEANFYLNYFNKYSSSSGEL